MSSPQRLLSCSPRVRVSLVRFSLVRFSLVRLAGSLALLALLAAQALAC